MHSSGAACRWGRNVGVGPGEQGGGGDGRVDWGGDGREGVGRGGGGIVRSWSHLLPNSSRSRPMGWVTNKTKNAHAHYRTYILYRSLSSGAGLVGRVAKTGECVNLTNNSKDFTLGEDRKCGSVFIINFNVIILKMWKYRRSTLIWIPTLRSFPITIWLIFTPFLQFFFSCFLESILE